MSDLNSFDPIKSLLLQAIEQNGARNYAEFGKVLGVSETTVKRRLGELKAEGALGVRGATKRGVG